MAIEIGQQAPDFELKKPDNEAVSLSGLKGTPVLLVFYPFTFTGVCQGELCSLRDDLGDFETANAQVLAISNDSRHAQAKWAKEQGFTFPLLSDFWPHGEVSRAYGVFDEKLGAATRTTFVIDKAGTIVSVFASPNLGTPREKAAYEAALAQL